MSDAAREGGEGWGMRRAVTAVLVVGLLGAGALGHGVAGEMAAPSAASGWDVHLLDQVKPPAPAEQARGERLLTESVRLLRDTDSVRMAADIRSGGRRVRFDLLMDRAGNCVGTLDGGPGCAASSSWSRVRSPRRT